MWYDWGNPPINSSALSATDPSTATLIAEIDSTQFDAQSSRTTGYRVTWIVGASTTAQFQLEHALSTGLGSTALRDRVTVFTASNQSGQFVTTVKREAGDRLRVRVAVALTATVNAKISAEALS